MKTVQRSFAPSSRYQYDFGACTPDRGWAQLDTGQDASYYGTWINPTSRKILVYCEGDVILTSVDTDAELAGEVDSIRRWNLEQGHRFMGIDPGFNDGLRGATIAAGLAGFFHASDEDFQGSYIESRLLRVWFDEGQEVRV